MGHRATLIAVVAFAAVACGSSKNSNNLDADASIIGTGGSSGFSTGSGGSTGNGTGSNGTGTGSGTGGSAASGTGGSGSSSGMNAGTGGFGGFNRDGGTATMIMCPATQPMDGATCMGGGGFGGRRMSCMFGETSCRCRRGMWACFMPMPPDDQDGGM